MDLLVKKVIDIWKNPDIHDTDESLASSIIELVLNDDKRLETLYCIEGDYTGEDRPIALALQRLNDAVTAVSRQRDKYYEQLKLFENTGSEKDAFIIALRDAFSRSTNGNVSS